MASTPAPASVPAKPRCAICGTDEGEILAFGPPERADDPRNYECRACWGPDDEPFDPAHPNVKRLREELQGLASDRADSLVD